VRKVWDTRSGAWPVTHMSLTDTGVKALRPKISKKTEKLGVYRVADSRGLCVEVRPSGARLWRYRYRWLGTSQLLALGEYPDISLAQARERRDAARKQLANGINPNEARRVERHAKVAAGKNTFEAVAIEWLAKMQGRWTDHHASDVRRSLLGEAFPAIGKRPVAELSTPEIIECLKKIEGRGAIEVAHRTQQRISAVCRFAVQTGLATYNPAADLRGVLKTRPVKPQLAMPTDALPAFLRALDADRSVMPQTRIGLLLIVLTAVRTGELRGARWDEFDLANDEWRIPASRMKMRQPHLVPLTRQTSALVLDLQKLGGNSELLFPSRSNITRPMSENTLLFGLYRLGFHSRATVHGFRSVFSSWANESGFHPDAIERQLSHGAKDKVRAAYDRSLHLAERRRLMKEWADHVDTVRASVDGAGNVVTPIGRKRARA
jgi:integrase